MEKCSLEDNLSQECLRLTEKASLSDFLIGTWHTKKCDDTSAADGGPLASEKHVYVFGQSTFKLKTETYSGSSSCDEEHKSKTFESTHSYTLNASKQTATTSHIKGAALQDTVLAFRPEGDCLGIGYFDSSRNTRTIKGIYCKDIDSPVFAKVKSCVAQVDSGFYGTPTSLEEVCKEFCQSLKAESCKFDDNQL